MPDKFHVLLSQVKELRDDLREEADRMDFEAGKAVDDRPERKFEERLTAILHEHEDWS